MTRSRRAGHTAVLASVAALAVAGAPGTGWADPVPVPCSPVWVTADCVDVQYSRPVIDSERDITDPVPVRQVSGHFEGTDKRFTFYFPPEDQWQGRFFQSVYPLVDENALPGDVAFGADSGAYTVQTNGGGGFAVDAAAAKFSKTVAARYYGHAGRIYGYVWGGSGGSYQTIGAMENSTGVWDGAVPYIVGVPTSIPSNFFVREFARIVLQHKAPEIAAAVAPGGSGDPFAVLDETGKAVLGEVTNMGVPLRAWEDYRYVLGQTPGPFLAGAPQGLLGFGAQVRQIDPTYADDFWSKPGYLGTEQSRLGEMFRAWKIDHLATVTRVDRGADNAATSLVLDSVPDNPRSTALDLTLYSADGTTSQGTLTGTLDPATKTLVLDGNIAAGVRVAIAPTSKVRIDNRWGLALPAYPRHQVPADTSFHAFDQYRAAEGTPRYPQRPVPIGPPMSMVISGGATHSGRINGKVIAVCNLLDTDAFPWDGDWYGNRVRHALGNRSDDTFRLWYNDNADHIAPGRTDRLIDYTGILHQALRDVATWVETGRAPAPSTRYTVDGNQISVASGAIDRLGIQPVVQLDSDGTKVVEVSAGQPVTLTAGIRVPPGTGRIVRLDWNATGTGDFTPLPIGSPEETLEVTHTVTYDTPGTYYPAVRATSHRTGDTTTPYAGVQNIGRIRVVVR
ncbi:hypothetical protein [Nocardia cyriacigeorgica]|uniref:hypothetical protein n=1 Tax=Nocardia cyriacigeorgica TaxID=135487 RepID=UPI001BB2752A|nr:hypothetical protein [Nocardia cyriacigeorgica]